MNFGVTTDYFKLADTNWRPQTDALTPTAAGKAQAADSHGDIHAQTVFGKANAYSTSYKVVNGAGATDSFVLSAKIKLGTVVAIDSLTKAVVTGIQVVTNNRDFPVVTVSGPQYFGDSLTQNLYTPPGVATLYARKKAQAIGVTLAAGNRLNSSTANFTLQVVNAMDSLGVIKKTDAYGGEAEASAEAVNATAAPAIVADTANGWAVAKDQDINMTNTDYGRGTLSVFKAILPDS
jgi:hypothetical protein